MDTLSPTAFRVRIQVRRYEVDAQLHLGSATYLQYAEHARWECMKAAGVDLAAFRERGLGPVRLEETITFLAELTADDEVDVTCAVEFTGGKTFRVVQEFLRPDGTAAARLVGVTGIMDLRERRLVADPEGVWRSVARDPELLFAAAAG